VTLRRRLKALCERTGVRYEGREVHGLRHTAGTLMYARTKNLRAVAQHLRHAQLDTAAIYAEMDDSEFVERLRVLRSEALKMFSIRHLLSNSPGQFQELDQCITEGSGKLLA